MPAPIALDEVRPSVCSPTQALVLAVLRVKTLLFPAPMVTVPKALKAVEVNGVETIRQPAVVPVTIRS